MGDLDPKKLDGLCVAENSLYIEVLDTLVRNKFFNSTYFGVKAFID